MACPWWNGGRPHRTNALLCIVIALQLAICSARVTRHTPSLAETPKPTSRTSPATKDSHEDIGAEAFRRETLRAALEQLFEHPSRNKAVAPLKKLAKEGDPDSHFYLGFMYSLGLGGLEPSPERAILHYSFAAIGASDEALAALAFRYYSGRGVRENCETALDLYRRVATVVERDRVQNSRSPLPIEKVRLADEFDDPSGPTTNQLDRDLLQYLQFLADKGDLKAQVNLGQLLYLGGRNVAPDPVRAYRYLSRAAAAGDSHAMALLGKMYFEGSEPVGQSNETALKYFTMSAERGNALGMTSLARMYRIGCGVPIDHGESLRLLKRASDQGFADALADLALMYYHGIGVEKSYPLAFKFFKQASHQGHTSAYYYLGLMLGQGTGVSRNCRNSVFFMKEVAERGRWSSHMNKAYQALVDGRVDEALVRYMLLGELGSEVAQSNAAHILTNAETKLYDANTSLHMAVRFWLMESNQGSSSARLKLGDAHFYGEGLPKDRDLAVSYYRLAATDQYRPSAQALFNLGLMHEQGDGVERDPHLARRYLHLAATISDDAQLPVNLMLIKMSMAEAFRESLFWQLIESNLSDWLGESWDLRVMNILATIFLMLLILRALVL